MYAQNNLTLPSTMTDANSPYYFLLKTENYQPLLELVDQLTAKIKENQSSIDRLVNQIDGNFAFPILPDNSDSTPNTGLEKHQSDPLKSLLNQKYNLDEIRITDERQFDHIENVKIRSLLIDNEKLRTIKAQKISKNNQLFEIYKEYELFIIETILPALRKDIYQYNAAQLQTIKDQEVEAKFEKVDSFWNRYSAYIGTMHNLVTLCHRLIAVLDVELNQNEIRLLQVKIEIINNLVAYIKG